VIGSDTVRRAEQGRVGETVGGTVQNPSRGREVNTKAFAAGRRLPRLDSPDKRAGAGSLQVLPDPFDTHAVPGADVALEGEVGGRKYRGWTLSTL
jgi:hypothetical protein